MATLQHSVSLILQNGKLNSNFHSRRSSSLFTIPRWRYLLRVSIILLCIWPRSCFGVVCYFLCLYKVVLSTLNRNTRKLVIFVSYLFYVHKKNYNFKDETEMKEIDLKQKFEGIELFRPIKLVIFWINVPCTPMSLDPD